MQKSIVFIQWMVHSKNASWLICKAIKSLYERVGNSNPLCKGLKFSVSEKILTVVTGWILIKMLHCAVQFCCKQQGIASANLFYSLVQACSCSWQECRACPKTEVLTCVCTASGTSVGFIIFLQSVTNSYVVVTLPTYYTSAIYLCLCPVHDRIWRNFCVNKSLEC